MTETKSEAIYTKVMSILNENCLKSDNIVGQCYDGAANMRGVHNGLSARIQRNSPKALYVYCYAHQLNLALEHACESNKYVRNTIDKAKSLYDFIEGGSKRHALFQHIQNENNRTTLKR